MQTHNFGNVSSPASVPVISKYQELSRQSAKLSNIRAAVKAWNKATPGNAQNYISQLVAKAWFASGGRGLLLAGSVHGTKVNFFRMINTIGPKYDKYLEMLTPVIVAVIARDNEKVAREFGLIETTRPELIASNIKECSEFQQVSILGAPVDEMVKEGREAVESIMKLIPMESWGQVLGGIITMTPGIM